MSRDSICISYVTAVAVKSPHVSGHHGHEQTHCVPLVHVYVPWPSASPFTHSPSYVDPSGKMKRCLRKQQSTFPSHPGFRIAGFVSVFGRSRDAVSSPSASHSSAPFESLSRPPHFHPLALLCLLAPFRPNPCVSSACLALPTGRR